MKIEKPRTIKTPWGTAKINDKGYYQISSRKEGNNSKTLHRLIYEKNSGPIPDGYEIHHRNGDKTDNCIYNLRCLSKSEHRKLHTEGENHPMYGKKHSEESKRKMSESKKGENHPMFRKNHSDETRQKISESTSKSNNTSRYYRVSKMKKKDCKQGFTWRYSYHDDGKQKAIVSVSLDKLKKKVLAKGLPWKKFD